MQEIIMFGFNTVHDVWLPCCFFCALEVWISFLPLNRLSALLCHRLAEGAPELTAAAGGLLAIRNWGSAVNSAPYIFIPMRLPYSSIPPTHTIYIYVIHRNSMPVVQIQVVVVDISVIVW